MKSMHKADDENDASSGPPKKVIKFRNYTPQDPLLKEKKIEKAKPAKVLENIGEHLEKGKLQTAVEDVDLTTLAPRKPDWDLKRDVTNRMDKLEKRTQKAIVELIRERLKAEDDLSKVVNMATD
ncbi:coiled-coil domain-containing protein 12 isoform X1 [Hydra vulgaris]|uniref:coiled-coil domain-containing protein 12 isoform X1 n=1 Tax=Hydra vulgaris TaxID=6087 RepID=UPI000192589C|nr:coiled-coil domain-containing protein 12-like [Hydra vulgaris]